MRTKRLKEKFWPLKKGENGSQLLKPVDSQSKCLVKIPIAIANLLSLVDSQSKFLVKIPIAIANLLSF